MKIDIQCIHRVCSKVLGVLIYCTNEGRTCIHIIGSNKLSKLDNHGSCMWLSVERKNELMISVLQRDEGITLTVANALRNQTLWKVDVNLQISHTSTFTSKPPQDCLQNSCTCR